MNSMVFVYLGGGSVTCSPRFIILDLNPGPGGIVFARPLQLQPAAVEQAEC